jgi:hypothetical protein
MHALRAWNVMNIGTGVPLTPCVLPPHPSQLLWSGFMGSGEFPLLISIVFLTRWADGAAAWIVMVFVQARVIGHRTRQCCRVAACSLL